MRIVLACFISVVLASATIGGLYTVIVFSIEDNIADSVLFKQQQEKAGVDYKEFYDVWSSRDALQNQATQLDRIALLQLRVNAQLRNIIGQLPDQVWLTALEIDTSRARAEGFAPDLSQVTLILKNLEDKKICTKSRVQDAVTQSQNGVKFVLECELSEVIQ